MALLFVGNATAQETATLIATFRYLGRPPAGQPITPLLDRQFCGSVPIPDERMIVHGDNHRLKNVVLYVYTGRRGTVLPEQKRRTETKLLQIKQCRFEPHILLAQKGDTLRVEDHDPVGHNANFQFFNNAPLGITRPVGASWQRSLDESEPAPVPVRCNIHPWMNAYLLVLDHRLAGISDGDGRLEITGLPVGQTIVFRAFHESARLKEVVVDGTAEMWQGGKFERVLQAGVNDLGVVGIPASAFTIDRTLDGKAGQK
ncbi:methylamine utilization protein [Stieleria sp. ICT_E10.1]|uniref:methylamine utilization protein n=1 Tax=Stieleria sedimenti TaxID=2976331 RepID=UPI00217F7E39|nr:methylamine utilization protein [Stieleria sedimenti]MCS7465228.1 methylamine utilization protein [Stieleria sedimenti]